MNLKCLRCGYKWSPRSLTPPRHCPKCNSPYWNKPRVLKKKKESKISVNKLLCLRCGHKWFPRSTKCPKHCAKCNSLYWNKPKGWWKKMKNKEMSETDISKYYEEQAMQRRDDEK